MFLPGTLSDLLPPWGHALATSARDDSNGNGNGGGGPALATDERHDNNGNGYVQGEGGRGGNSGGNNGDDNDSGGDNKNDGSDDNENGGSDDNDNGGNRGDGGDGCGTATAMGIDKEDNNQLEVAMDNRRGRSRGGGRVPTAGSHGFNATSL